MTHKEIADTMFPHNPTKHAEIQHYLSLNEEQRKVYDESYDTVPRETIIKALDRLTQELNDCSCTAIEGDLDRYEVDESILKFIRTAGFSNARI